MGCLGDKGCVGWDSVDPTTPSSFLQTKQFNVQISDLEFPTSGRRRMLLLPARSLLQPAAPAGATSVGGGAIAAAADPPAASSDTPQDQQRVAEMVAGLSPLRAPAVTLGQARQMPAAGNAGGGGG
jgi:hypothetical protein